jgi:branched-chain amino acid transport system permease protein
LAYWLALGATIALLSIVALGLYPMFMTGQLQAGQAAFMGVAGYTVGLLTDRYQVNLLLALAAGTAAAAGAGWIVAQLVRQLRGFYYAMATLAFGQAVVLIVTETPALGGPLGLQIDPTLEQPALLATFAVVAVGLSLFGRSKHALLFRISSNERLAASLGVDVARSRRQSFTLGCALAGLGGGLFISYYGVIGPVDIGFAASFVFVLYVAFGGVDTVAGAILGVAVLTLLPELLRWTANLRYVVYGSVIVVLMVFRPRGLVYRRGLGEAIAVPRLARLRAAVAGAGLPRPGAGKPL